MDSTAASPPEAPNTARIIDYWLGGRHHLPVDIEAAKTMTEIFEGGPNVFRVLRRFLGRACKDIRGRGIDQFLVFGSGLPTCDNVHEVVPDARVLYTDIDTTNIAMGREILQSATGAGYTFCDAANLTTLNRAAMDLVLGPIEKLGMIFIGVAAFIPDDKLKPMLATLYEFAPPGSYLAIDFDGEMGHQFPKWLAILEAAGTPLYMRTPEMIRDLLGPWQLTEPGITPVGAWRNMGADEDASFPTFMYGCVAHRPA